MTNYTVVALCLSGVAFLWMKTRPNPRRTALLFDVNHILAYSVFSSDWADPTAKRVNRRNAYVRPGSVEFLERLRGEWARVGVWTSARRHNAAPILPHLGMDESTFLSQEHCVAIPREDTYPLFVKQLCVARGVYPDCSDFILVDHSFDKIVPADWSRVVVVESWDSEHEGTSFEDMRRLIMEHPVKKFMRNFLRYLFTATTHAAASSERS